ncbi:874_t:CDS:1, partial [Scutellospora calospora]
NEEVDLATRRQQLLQSIASGGMELGSNGKAKQDEDADEGPEVQSNKVAAEKAALAERLRQENIAKTAGDSEQASSAASRRGLDVNSAQRMLYGSLGVRPPKTQEQKDTLQKRLAGRQGTEMPKRKSSAQAEQAEVTEEAEADDEDAWLQRIDLRAVECCEEG